MSEPRQVITYFFIVKPRRVLVVSWISIADGTFIPAPWSQSCSKRWGYLKYVTQESHLLHLYNLFEPCIDYCKRYRAANKLWSSCSKYYQWSYQDYNIKLCKCTSDHVAKTASCWNGLFWKFTYFKSVNGVALSYMQVRGIFVNIYFWS